MPKALDLTGQKFGYLTAIEKAPSKNGKTYWKCQCECGKETLVQTCHLKGGKIISCGCYAKKHNPLMLQDMEIKRCVICGKEFKPNNIKRVYCFDCVPQGLNSAEQTRARARALKHKLIEYKGGKCEKCGYNKCEGALQFHHLNSDEKEFTIAQANIGIYNLEDFLKEVDKCILLCANCHAEEHWINIP